MRLTLLAAEDGSARRRREPVGALAREALAGGADGFELTVTADLPASTTTRRRGRRRARQAEAGTGPEARSDDAVLADALALSGRGTVISVAVEEETAAAAVIKAARTEGRASDLWLRSPDIGLLTRLADGLGSGLRLVHTPTARLDGGAYERVAAGLSRAGISAVRLPWDTWSLGLTTLFERFGLGCEASGVRETRHLDRLVVAGVGVASVIDLDRLPELVEHRAAFLA